METFKALLPEGSTDGTAVPSAPSAVLELPEGTLGLTQSEADTAAQPLVEESMVPVSDTQSVANLDSAMENLYAADVAPLDTSEALESTLQPQAEFARLFGPSAAPEESAQDQVPDNNSTLPSYGAEESALDEHEDSVLAYNGALAPSRKWGPACDMAKGLSSLWKSTHNFFRQIFNLS